MSKDHKGNSNRFEVPGRASIEDNRAISDDTVTEYGCGFCDYTCISERFVRVHITHVDDSDHRHRNGFMPETHVQTLNEAGAIVGDISGDDSTVDKSAGINPENVPDGLTTKQEQIGRALVLNPNKSVTEIQEIIFEQVESEEDAPSQSYIHKTLEKYFGVPQDQGVKNDDDPATSRKYEQLTDKQAAVVDELMKEEDPLDPDRSKSEIACAAGCHDSYIGTVMKKHDTLIRHRWARMNKSPQARRNTVLDGSTGAESADSDDVGIVIPKEVCIEFEETLAVLKDKAEHEAKIGGTAGAHAQGQLYVLDLIEDFLENAEKPDSS